MHEAGLLNLSIGKARQILGWSPKWDFLRTVDATVSWYRSSVGQGESVVNALTRSQISDYLNFQAVD